MDSDKDKAINDNDIISSDNTATETVQDETEIISEYEIEENDESDTVEDYTPLFDVDATKPRMLQIIFGILAGVGISASLFLPLILNATDNVLLNYLFVIIFLIVILIERGIQRKYRVRLYHFTRAWLISLIAGIVGFVIIGICTGTMTF